MGKCPAPCDGSISMDHYRLLIDWSAQAIVDPEVLIRDNKRRMQQAAAELRFESAAKIKSYLESLNQLGRGSLRHMRRLSDFRFISLQRGPREGTAKIFLITPGRIAELAGLIAEPAGAAELLHLVRTLAGEGANVQGVDPYGAERIGVVAHHLFLARSIHGVFIQYDELEEQALIKAYRTLLKQKPVDENPEAEGVVKELQGM